MVLAASVSTIGSSASDSTSSETATASRPPGPLAHLRERGFRRRLGPTTVSGVRSHIVVAAKADGVTIGIFQVNRTGRRGDGIDRTGRKPRLRVAFVAVKDRRHCPPPGFAPNRFARPFPSPRRRRVLRGPAQAMLSRLKTIIALMRNPKVSKFPKFLVVGAVLYILMPFDAIPDLAPVVGWLDDIMFLVGALTMLFGAAPKPKEPAGPIIDITPEPPRGEPPSSR